MPETIKDQLSAFLQWYNDLYGKEWYVENSEALLKLLAESGQKKSTASTPVGGNTPLLKFKSEIENCQKCSLHKTRTNFVFGDGNGNADIMFIGEAPGRDEDLQGLPFVGRSGQLLNKLLANFQLKREDVYIANILKSRPPNNRDPLPEEVEACIPYLHRQIELIQPRILVALGRVAAQNLLNTTESLTRMRKKVWSYRNIPMIVTFHPAYVLRNMNAMNDAIDDMRFVVEYYGRLVGN